MATFIWATVLATVVSATPWTFTHMDSTWTLEVEGNKLHVTADCPETKWCGFGFNKDVPKMDGADVFTFGYHAGVDLSDCPSCGCGGCGGCGCGCGTTRRLRAAENPYVPRVRDLKLHLPAFVPKSGAVQSLQNVGGVVGVAMNSVLLAVAVAAVQPAAAVVAPPRKQAVAVAAAQPAAAVVAPPRKQAAAAAVAQPAVAAVAPPRKQAVAAAVAQAAAAAVAPPRKQAVAAAGQMFCAMGLTKKASTGTMVSMSQCNLHGHSITIDAKQDLTDYKLKFENGRMKVDAHRALNTGDATDYVLTPDTHYYIVLTVGTGISVGYHGSSGTHTLVCDGTLASGFAGPGGCQSQQSASSTTRLGLLFFGWLLTRVM
eukprot:symbB.v1.2.008528.t1/scaffold532.1/size190944/2